MHLLIMLSKKDLIYLGAILLWQSPVNRGSKDNVIDTVKEFYNKIFKEDE